MTFERLYSMLLEEKDDAPKLEPSSIKEVPSKAPEAPSPTSTDSPTSPTDTVFSEKSPISPALTTPATPLPPGLAALGGAFPSLKPPAPLTSAILSSLADEFAAQVPEETLSLAQIQEFLIRQRGDPRRAVEGVKGWLEELEEDKRKMEELRTKWAGIGKDEEKKGKKKGKGKKFKGRRAIKQEESDEESDEEIEEEDGEVKITVEGDHDRLSENGSDGRKSGNESPDGFSEIVSPSMSAPWGRDD
jgi:hypothetical protein